MDDWSAIRQADWKAARLVALRAEMKVEHSAVATAARSDEPRAVKLDAVTVDWLVA